MHWLAAPCPLAVCHGTSRPSRLTWRVALDHGMVVHLESGIATAAREAHYVVLAIVHDDGGLVDGDVIRPHVEDDPYLPLILRAEHSANAVRRVEGSAHGELPNLTRVLNNGVITRCGAFNNHLTQPRGSAWKLLKELPVVCFFYSSHFAVFCNLEC